MTDDATFAREGRWLRAMPWHEGRECPPCGNRTEVGDGLRVLGDVLVHEGCYPNVDRALLADAAAVNLGGDAVVARSIEQKLEAAELAGLATTRGFLEAGEPYVFADRDRSLTGPSAAGCR